MTLRAPLLVLAVVCWPALAAAQLTQKCAGETWAELAAERYGDARWGAALAIHNRARGTERCKADAFVRFFGTIKHEVKLGQTVEAVVPRFLKSPGAVALVRARNRLPRGTQPRTKQILEIPAELVIVVGTRPEAELEEIPGLPPLDEIERYNQTKKLPKGGTVYVPLFVELKPRAPAGAPPAVTPPPPPPPVEPDAGVEEEPPPDEDDFEVETSTGGDVAISYTGERVVPKLSRTLQVEVAARPVAFLHRDHQPLLANDWSCNLCHAPDPRKNSEYLPVPIGVCTQCHASGDMDAIGLRAEQLPLTYSHALHLEPGRKVAQAGYNLECAACHAPVQASLRKLPGHLECGKCHNGVEARPAIAGDCSGCHGVAEEHDRLRQAQALLDVHLMQSERKDDLRFDHEPHVRYLGGADEKEACATCHLGVASSESVDEIEPPRMADCLECHRGLEKKLAGEVLALDRCRTCHIGTRPFVMPSFGSVTDKPLTHTPRFRRDHEDAAKKDDAVCQSCHPELAGANGDRCDRCHEQMRPRDHTARWREDPHGRAALRDQERCATCHLQDRCADCHSIRPRDHFPIERFRLQHSRSARRSLQRCFTCHAPQVDCARCHDTLGT